MFGYLAQKFLNKHIEVEVLQSAAGYYIGTACPLKMPISRESEEYYPSEAEAKKAMNDKSFTQRLFP